jgi:Uma2 family endonuclease
MSTAERAHMTLDEFLAWEAAQEEKWELVDGRPVLRRLRKEATAMAGGSGYHSLIGRNILGRLFGRHLQGGCGPYASDLKTVAAAGYRYPDVTVDCGRHGADTSVAVDPRIVFEVLSPSNTPFQLNRLLADYQSVASIEQIVFLRQDAPQAQTWRRAENGWMLEEIDGLDAAIDLPSVGASLPMAEIYEGVEFAAP